MKFNLSASLLCDNPLPWVDECREGEIEYNGGRTPNAADNAPTSAVRLEVGWKIQENIKSIQYMLCVD